jgi:hypothetical protein
MVTKLVSGGDSAREVIAYLDDDGGQLLQKFDYAEADAIVRIQRSSQEHGLDVREIGAGELKKDAQRGRCSKTISGK